MEMTKSVFVTGASTGIGRRITERLAAEGCYVYAGARKDSDLQALAAIKNVRALRLDVTNAQDIAAAVDVVAGDGRGLHGLVNNAGVITFSPVVGSDDEEFDLVMSVNVYGPYRITKAFGPLIVAGQGRIVTISSVAGVLAAKNFSAYSMSKHAMEAFTDCLAAEMEPLGVRVSVVEPGDFRTRIFDNLMERIGAHPQLPDASEFKGPDEVAAAVALALFEPKPKRRYLVAGDEHEAQMTIRKQIAQLVQLNERHRHSFDRNALIRMLDEESM